MDKIPYGTKYAFDNLAYIFPEADIRTSSSFPVFFDSAEQNDTLRSLLIFSPKFSPDSDEMNAIVRFASAGNQVFITSLNFNNTTMDILHLKMQEKYFNEGDSTGLTILDPLTKKWLIFNYPGLSIDPYFTDIDTNNVIVIGRDISGNPDYVRISYPNKGGIFVHLNPIAFCNFFLLHKKNRLYYEIALSYLPGNSRVVEWSDYFRYNRESGTFSALHFILSNRSLRWAFWITLILILGMLLLEIKRKQRPVEEIPERRNASVDFVRTVGRLYFQRKDNNNLAAKMVGAFLEDIRSRYNIPTSVLNDEFSKKLAFRTGRPVNEILELIRLIDYSRLEPNLTDQQLMELHKKINQISKTVL